MEQIKLLLLLIVFQYAFSACSKDTADNTDNNIEIPIAVLELSESTLTMDVRDEQTITVVKAPKTNETLVWLSDNKVVATVFNGIITAHQSGTAIITATLGTYTATCTVTVTERKYELVWSDEFDGTTLNMDNWTYETGTGNWGWGNNEAQYYTDRSENIRVEDGFLVIEAKKEAYMGSEYTSARIKTAHKKDFAYGKMEARIKVPTGKGTWSAFWMLGYGGWPRAGEIDIMEQVGYEPSKFHCALHTLTKNGMNGQNLHATQDLETDVGKEFHIITMEWVEKELFGYDRIYIYVDGVKIKTFAETPQVQESGDWPFNKNFYFILNLAIGGNWGGIQGVDENLFDNPVQYKIDYVRVYQLQ